MNETKESLLAEIAKLEKEILRHGTEPHQFWCSQSNVTMCNCRFPNGDDYIIGQHGPAPVPGACICCGKRCWPHTPCAKRLEASRGEGVAAPLEPTRQECAAKLEREWLDQQSILDFRNWLVEQLRIARQHGQIKADSMYLAFCGGRPTGEVIDWKAWERVANCANQSAAAVSKNLREELAHANFQLKHEREISLAVAEKNSDLIDKLGELKREITALRETK